MAQPRVTPYLIYLVFITTLGPLQFGYHLVSIHQRPVDNAMAIADIEI